MSDLSGADSLTTCERGPVGRQVDAVGRHHIGAPVAPAQPHGLDVRIAQSEAVDSRLGTILDISLDSRDRPANRHREEYAAPRDAGRVRGTEGIGHTEEIEGRRGNEVSITIP